MNVDNKHAEVAAARIEAEMTDANKADWGQRPKHVKGGVLATADIELIKRALHVFIYNTVDPISASEEKQVANLLHRLNSRI